VTTKEVTDGNPLCGIGVTSGFSANGIEMTSPNLAWTVALADELHRRGFPVWYPDGRPVSFIGDDWSDDFPLVWRDGWFSAAA
jgi:hypothetical protein